MPTQIPFSSSDAAAAVVANPKIEATTTISSTHQNIETSSHGQRCSIVGYNPRTIRPTGDKAVSVCKEIVLVVDFGESKSGMIADEGEINAHSYSLFSMEEKLAKNTPAINVSHG